MSDTQIQTTEQPTVAFVLSLLAGLWMLAAGSMMGGFGWGGMMGGWHGDMMRDWMWGRGMGTFGVLWPWSRVFVGIVVLIGAVMLYVKPRQRRGWGVLVLVASALNFIVGMGGLLAGALGVIGGMLSLSTKD
jgi:hypothetical protein